MALIPSYRQQFEAYIKKESLARHPEGLYAPIDYTIRSGGKRIRPVLMMLAHDCFKAHHDGLYPPAFGIELLHNFTLLHDDIMDQSLMRRGQPTVHEKWNAETAILSGDAMSILAYKYIAKTPNNLSPVLECFSDMALKVCEGQQLDMDLEHADTAGKSQYIEMISLKTAALIAGSLKIGALIAGANLADIEHLYKFGHHLGLAFQLQDDYLDCFGTQDTFGKPIGQDIKNDKKTYLNVLAQDMADNKQLEHLDRFKNLSDPDERTEKTISLFREIGVDRHAQTEITRYFDDARKHVMAINGREEVQRELLNFMESLSNREH